MSMTDVVNIIRILDHDNDKTLGFSNICPPSSISINSLYVKRGKYTARIARMGKTYQDPGIAVAVDLACGCAFTKKAIEASQVSIPPSDIGIHSS
jgi:hypothetical protein